MEERKRYRGTRARGNRVAVPYTVPLSTSASGVRKARTTVFLDHELACREENLGPRSIDTDRNRFVAVKRRPQCRMALRRRHEE